MSNEITIVWDDKDAQAMFARFVDGLTRPRPLMASIAEGLLHNTQDRYDRGVDPRGTPWAPLKPATLARKRTDKLLKERGYLYGQLRPDYGDDHAGIASAPLPYARIHQDGGLPDMAPGPAAVPARTYLGFGPEDQAMVLEEAAAFLRSLV